MSPLQTTMLGSGLFFAAAKIMTSVLETASGLDIVDTNVAVILTMLCTISWTGYFAALCRDQVFARQDAHMQTLETRLLREIPGFGEQCVEDGRRDAAREFARSLPTQTTRSGRLSPVD